MSTLESVSIWVVVAVAAVVQPVVVAVLILL